MDLIDSSKCVYDQPYPCGHGECEKTGAWSPEGLAAAILRAPLGEGDRRASGRWSPDDLDRCEHGRHSIDHCFDCPGQESTGNLFLLSPIDARHEVRVVEGRVEVRIGTMVHGEPIWVVVRDKPRETDRG